MRFSIIIPNYNNGDWLKGCLDSIVSQSFTDYEVILVDDMSDDQSLETAREYAKKYDQIQLVELKSKRLCGGARNEGLIRAKGDYIFCIDGDDKLKENALQYINDNISGEDVIFLDFEVILPNNGRDEFTPLFQTKLDAYKSLACAPFTKIIKRELCPFFPEGTLYDDRIHHYWTLNNCTTFKCLKEPVYSWNRLNMTSAMHQGLKWDIGNFNFCGMLYKLITETEDPELKAYYIGEIHGYLDWINEVVTKLWK